MAQAFLQLAIVWSHATADQANGGWFPTGCVAAEGHGWVVLSSPCVHWPSSLPRTPPPELVTGQHTTQGQLPLLESKQRKRTINTSCPRITLHTKRPQIKLKTLQMDVGWSDCSTTDSTNYQGNSHQCVCER